MKLNSISKYMFISLLAFGLLMPGWAAAQITFARIVVFGTSLSDPGNAFALLSRASHGYSLTKPQITPPYDTLNELLIPDAPYAKGGHHFSNGATWIEQLARGRGLAGNVRPAFQGSNTKATNYAVGGARAIDDLEGVNLPDQIGAFLLDYPQAPGDALYVVEMGSNDVRDALVAAVTLRGDPGEIISNALESISNSIEILYGAGARKFLVVNVPNLALVPAVKALDEGAVGAAAELTVAFNTGLVGKVTSLADLPGIEIAQGDAYKTITDLYSSPQDFGLTEVDKPCVTPNTPPYSCKMPDTFLFWDGIHPTKAVHAIFAQNVAATLSSPSP